MVTLNAKIPQADGVVLGGQAGQLVAEVKYSGVVWPTSVCFEVKDPSGNLIWSGTGDVSNGQASVDYIYPRTAGRYSVSMCCHGMFDNVLAEQVAYFTVQSVLPV